jgi:hypothetical protein
MKMQQLFRGAVVLILSGSAVLSAAAPGHAKGGGLPRISGIISKRPAGKTGVWVIGGRRFTAVRSTQLDTLEGPLRVGACAKVRYRGSVAVEIDSEPASDC